VNLSFSKMHGLGNDFVVFEDLAGELDMSPEAIQWLCDRRFGIGADGVIFVRSSEVPEADFHMAYFNSDGSIAEMCGNGIRCLACYVVDHELLPADRDELVVSTLGGLKPISVNRDLDGVFVAATVDMGEPILDPKKVPTLLQAETPGDPVISRPLVTSVGTFEVTAVSMGNPHAVLWVDDVDEADVESIGPAIETHEMFPARTNVEFAQVVDAGTIRLRVWERGCAETLACGTGACATLVAASLTGRIEREATIELPGGLLDIHWAEDNHVYMTGSATEVFIGALLVEDDGE
jgi:diaminopimelate epimerase